MLNFGEQGTGTEASRKLKIKNIGNGKLLFKVDLSGLPSAFTIKSGTLPVVSGISEYRVLAGNSKSLTVYFDPMNVAQQWSGNIGINSSDTSDPYFTIPVNAISVSGHLKIIPKKLVVSGLTFGTVPAGQPKTKSLELTNGGTGLLTVTVGSLSAPFAVVSGAGSYPLNPGKSRTVKVTFLPTTAGSYPAQTLTIISNDTSPSGALVQITVTGTGD